MIKNYFEPRVQLQEVKTGRYVADIYNELGITEIQTRDFYRMREKLEYFLTLGRVTVVYPIPHEKWISWIDLETGTLGKRSKSPKRGRPWQIFHELYGIKYLLRHPNLSICALLIDMDEYRYLDGWSRDKKRGSSRCDRIPLSLHGELYINEPDDYLRFLPDGLDGAFCSRDFSALTGLGSRNVWEALEVLQYVGIIEKKGKKGNAIIYEKSESCGENHEVPL